MSYAKAVVPLEGKLALVTGAGVGIGLGVAEELARQGAAVVLHYAHSAAGARKLADEIVAEGGRAKTVVGNLGQVAECRRVVEEAAAYLGGIDILVNNAGVTSACPFGDVPEELFDELMGINVRGSFFCAQQALPWLLRRGGGSIINMTSIQANYGAPNSSAYATTKAALIGFTRQLAIELAPTQIRVNAVAPGLVEVPRYYDNPTYTRESGNQRVPWGRVGLPIDVAKVVAFLAADGSEFTTGQVIYVDGGTSAKLALAPSTDAKQS